MLATVALRSNKTQRAGFSEKTLTAQLIITYHLETMYCSHCDGGNRRKTKILPHSHYCDAKTPAARHAPAKSQGLGTTCPRTSQALFSPFSSPPPQADPQGLAIPAYTVSGINGANHPSTQSQLPSGSHLSEFFAFTLADLSGNECSMWIGPGDAESKNKITRDSGVHR
jgi:hypothetical protein